MEKKKYKKRKKRDGAYCENGRWRYDFSIKKKRYRGSLPECSTQSQAVRAVTEIRNRIYDGTYGDGNKTPFVDFIKEFYEPDAKLKRSYETHEKHNLKAICKWFKDYNLEEITPFVVEKFMRERLKMPVKGKPSRSQASVNRTLTVLPSIFSMAKRNKLITDNPCSGVRRLREDNERTRALTVEEEAQLFAAISKPYESLRPVIVVALNTGMRQAEIVNLKWSQIDWERNRVAVINTKTEHDRFVPMNQTLRQLFVKLARERKDHRLFPDLTADKVALSFRYLSKKAKLHDFHFHDLRHTFATRLIGNSVDLITIAALLGHSSLDMVKRYAHPSEPHMAVAVEKLADFAEKCQENVTGEVLQFKSLPVK